MCLLVSIGYSLHGHLNSSCRKNLSWYSPMAVWLTIALEALAQSKLECLKNLSHGPPLAYKGSMRFKSSSNSSKKCCPLASNAWNVILQLLRILLHLFFLSKFYEDLQGNMGTRSNFFVSLLTKLWRVQFLRLGQSQNSMELSWPLLKNSLSSLEMNNNWIW